MLNKNNSNLSCLNSKEGTSRSKRLKATEDSDGITMNMYKLQLARRYLSPVIDEIISHATSYTQDEFQNILDSNGAICTISSSQYSQACNASRLIREVTNESGAYLYPHGTVGNMLVNNFQAYPVDELPTTHPDDNDTMFIDKDLMKQLVDLHELIVSTIQRCREFSMYQMPTTSTKKRMSEVLFRTTSMDMSRVKSKLESEFIIFDKSHSNHELESNIKIPRAISTHKNDAELTHLKKMYNELSVAVENLKRKNYVPSLIGPSQSQHSQQLLLNTPSEEIENIHAKVIKCLKELDQMKDLLYAMDNPDLTVDKIESSKTCCKLQNYPHIHAKLNGIPVIIKMNKETIDILLAEKDNTALAKTGALCKCHHVATTTSNKKHIKSTMRSKNFEMRRVEIDPLTINDALTDDYEVYDLIDAKDSLPYIVNRKSLPNVNICPPLNVDLLKLKSNLRSSVIEHPQNPIKSQLEAFGIDNIIRASYPAKCCRITAVVNEYDNEDEPFRASLNSLPLTTSDLKMISNVTGHDDECMINLNEYLSKFEYFTNFQENFSSNIGYFVPRVYEVWFFKVLRKEVKNILFPSSSDLSSHITKILKRFIKTQTKYEGKKKEFKRKKHVHNKRCQTDKVVKEKIYEPKVSSHFPHNFYYCGVVKVKHKKLKKSFLPTYKDDDKKGKRSYRQLESNEMPIKDKGISCNMNINGKKKATYSKHRFTSQKQTFPATISNLGTIYETDEKRNLKKKNNHQVDPFQEFLKSPIIQNNFKRIITTKAAIKTFKETELDENKFWNLFFMAKKLKKKCMSKKDKKKNYKEHISPPPLAITNSRIMEEDNLQQKRKHKSKIPRLTGLLSNNNLLLSRKNKKTSLNSLQEMLPYLEEKSTTEQYASKTSRKSCRKIKKQEISSNTAIFETSSIEKLFTAHIDQHSLSYSRTDKNTLKNSSRKSSHERNRKKENTTLFKMHQISHSSLQPQIFFNQTSEQTTKKVPTENSLKMLKLKGTKNCPGYVAVLHPICGCPEVSIFIPCYCGNDCIHKANFSSQKVEDLLCDKNGKHIILPSTCRICKYHGGDKLK